ncbi:DUF4235 domain-containing protein [Aeromicrobium wangtongii]|uniref:DUF4235 domain-containing protein n=1 Tax=Aeromicrobium wangtongii TaxID=2969247 RepID=A0ABY5M9G2_9ACTN|nr:DUF4235 domain-containing protein [Aeromicrobium wangtongii]MCD9199429.1 DUF4235 domain-containing protein [Aeromicrobium wangtongii]MCL3817183.1 DUF4235 domain-containing protein [Aeromicrobium wangtongii]UUP13786.1 DUF4235 domain-containing protein [Aeromicrobium wangtongii]
MPASRTPSTSAKILYRPVGIVSSIVGGLVASMLFKQIWKRVSAGDDADPPGPLQSEYPFKEIVLAAVLQGAIYSVVKTVIQRQGAKGFERATGEWPGS